MKKFLLLSVYFFLFLIFSAAAQPSVLGTQLANGSYVTYNLNDIGLFRQYRLQAATSAGTGSRNWEFARGTAASTDYSVVWRPYTGGNTLSVNNYIPTSFANGAKYNTGGGASGLLPAITAGNYYTFNVGELAAADNVMRLLETSFNPATISTVTQTPAIGAVTANNSVKITATVSAAPASGENFFVRYSINGFGSSSIAQFTFSGTVGTAYIPCFGAGSTVSYYVYSSNKSAAAILSDVSAYGEMAHDMATLNLNNNGGPNYNYTVAAATSNFSGNYLVPSACYPTLASFLTAINTGTVTGPVTVDVAAGYTETAPAGGLVITATGTVTNTITFQKYGSGSNPLFTASSTHNIGSLTDAVIKIIGSDYLVIRNLSIEENPANTDTTGGSNKMTEFGIALLRASTSDGAQFNRIENNTITLGRIYTNSFGIYSSARHSATSVTSGSDPIALMGSNSNNRIYGNSISEVNGGIAFVGGSAAAFQDTGNDIGGSSSATGNILSNWGGASVVGNFASISTNTTGIFMNYQVADNVSYNTVTTVISGTDSVVVRGIVKDYSSVIPIGTFTSVISNNTVSITDNYLKGTIEGIRVQKLNLATAGLNIENNLLLNLNAGGPANDVNIVGIVNSADVGQLNINNNIFRNCNSSSTTAGFTAIYNQGTVTAAINLNNNKIGDGLGNAISFSDAAAGDVYGIYNKAGASSASLSIIGNDFRGFIHLVNGSGSHRYIRNEVASGNSIINSNTFTNISAKTSGNVTFISNNAGYAANTTHSISSNAIVTGFAKTVAGSSVGFYTGTGTSPSSATETSSGNNFSNVTLTGGTGVTGWTTTGVGLIANVVGNTFTNISGGSNLYVILQANGSANGTVSGNSISNVSGGGDIRVIYSTGGTQRFIGNTVTNILSSGSSKIVQGIFVTGGTNQSVVRNRIYDIRTSFSTGSGVSIGIEVSGGTGTTIANNVLSDITAVSSLNPYNVIGISLSPLVTGTSVTCAFNTVYLSSLATGTVFSSAALSATEFAALTLKNNILVNLSTPGATGKTVAYRRVTNNLTTYDASSNNNLFYAGTPSASRLIFSDGTNDDQTLADFKGRVTPRDANSISLSPTFLSTSGASADFLHINPTPTTQIQNGGIPVAGITDDFDGQTRNGLTPDIGADEFIAPNQNYWVGRVSSAWNLDSNWEANRVPVLADDAFVTGKYTFDPIITGIPVQGVRNLFITGAGNVTLDDTLQVAATITNSGILDAKTGSIELVGGGQTLSGSVFKNRALKNLLLKTAASLNATAGDTLNLNGALSFTNSGFGVQFNTGNNLTLVSSATGTASLSDLTVGGTVTGNSIVGDINVQRYITTPRKWQFLSPDATITTQSFNAAWMEGNAPTTPTIPTSTGYGMWITDPAGTGFDAVSPGINVKYWNGSDYVSVGNTNNNIHAYPAYMTYVRGDRAARGNNSTANNTVLRTKGTIHQGPQPPATLTAGGLLTAIGNPYPSAINLRTVFGSTSTSSPITVFVWDPKQTGTQGLGAFVTLRREVGDLDFKVLTNGGFSYPANTVVANTIASGQAFFLQPSASVNITYQFTEQGKNVTSPDVFFTANAAQSLQGRLSVRAGAETIPVDELVVNFSNTNNAAANNDDARKMQNTNENISVKVGATLLTGDYRREVAEYGADTVHINMANLRVKDYQWKFTPDNMDAPGRTGFLVDRMTGIQTPLNLAGENVYDFTVTNTAASYAADRFFIVFRPSAVVPVTFIRIDAKRQKDESVAVQWQSENEINLAHYEVERSDNSLTFSKIGVRNVTANNGGNAAYEWPDVSASRGQNFYRIKAVSVNGQVQYSRIAKGEPMASESEISVSPNPVSGRTVQLYTNNLAAGTYQVQLVALNGQVVHRSAITLSGTDSKYTLALSSGIAAGKYSLVIISANGDKTLVAVSVL